jgi:hypothetical protein
LIKAVNPKQQTVRGVLDMKTATLSQIQRVVRWVLLVGAILFGHEINELHDADKLMGKLVWGAILLVFFWAAKPWFDPYYNSRRDNTEKAEGEKK